MNQKVYIRNIDFQDMPGHGVGVIRGIEDVGGLPMFTVSRATVSDCAIPTPTDWVVSSASGVSAGKEGQGYRLPGIVQVDPLDYNDAFFGSHFGIVPSQWYLKNYRYGVRSLGQRVLITGASMNLIIAEPVPVVTAMAISNGISARTGSSPNWTPGSGTGNLAQLYDNTGAVEVIKALVPTIPIKIYNSTSKTIAANRPIQINLIMGRWYVHVGECG